MKLSSVCEPSPPNSLFLLPSLFFYFPVSFFALFSFVNLPVDCFFWYFLENVLDEDNNSIHDPPVQLSLWEERFINLERLVYGFYSFLLLASPYSLSPPSLCPPSYSLSFLLLLSPSYSLLYLLPLLFPPLSLFPIPSLSLSRSYSVPYPSFPPIPFPFSSFFPPPIPSLSVSPSPLPLSLPFPPLSPLSYSLSSPSSLPYFPPLLPAALFFFSSPGSF